MNADCSLLRDLIDMLEDGREFYDDAAQAAAADGQSMYREKARHYAALLADLRDWIAHGHGPGDDDGFKNLLDRINVSVRDAPPAREQEDSPMAAQIVPSGSAPRNPDGQEIRRKAGFFGIAARRDQGLAAPDGFEPPNA